ncbi:MAG: zinc-ribbon domain-containing protein [Deltaproteobacteria bacterium]|nr:zinc-ribbon domain-containing protein [Deltaproteobacteria bacterium]
MCRIRVKFDVIVLSSKESRKTMKYDCPHCGKRYDIRDDFLRSGSMKMRCRECKNVIVITTGEDAPPPLVMPGKEIPDAPRDMVLSMAPPGGDESSASEDLPVAVRSGEEDLIQEFDLSSPPDEARKPVPQAADLPTPRPVMDLDDAFELVGGAGAPSGPDLPAPKASTIGEDDFELDSPPPAEEVAPSAKPRAPSVPPVKPRVKIGAAKDLKGTIAGMPSPVRSEEARKNETMLGMPSPVAKTEVKPPVPPSAVDLPAPVPVHSPARVCPCPSRRPSRTSSSWSPLPRPVPCPLFRRRRTMVCSGSSSFPGNPPRRPRWACRLSRRVRRLSLQCWRHRSWLRRHRMWDRRLVARSSVRSIWRPARAPLRATRNSALSDSSPSRLHLQPMSRLAVSISPDPSRTSRPPTNHSAVSTCRVPWRRRRRPKMPLGRRSPRPPCRV